MKRIFILLLSALMLFSACEGDIDNTAHVVIKEGELNVIATIFPAYDFARAVTGESLRDLGVEESPVPVNLQMLIPPGAEIHDFEPTPKDIIAIKNCDIFIYNGGESDIWVEKILENISPETKVIAMTDCVDTLEEEIKEGMQEEGEEEEEGAIDEHVWTSPVNAMGIVRAIAEAFVSKTDNNDDAAFFGNNGELYCHQLNHLDSEFEEIVTNAERNTLVFADRFPFRYFTQQYNLDYFAAFPGCAGETEPDIKTVTFLIDKVKSEDIPAVFTIELSNKKLAENISKETGAKILQLHSCHNISKDDFQSGKTYVDIMLNNADVLKEALY
ncbi:MAG: metal ABC transporter substrate-binding protein [Oscillospiraceae bacterium]|jgi:zinc transport system substrate-binding protein|nr:metal ABC transporter substrate-binding protein [Oscillospiraceae bacterium]